MISPHVGTIVVAKVILYEVCDSSNQALGMSMLTVAFGVGIVIGPAAGGQLLLLSSFIHSETCLINFYLLTKAVMLFIPYEYLPSKPLL